MTNQLNIIVAMCAFTLVYLVGTVGIQLTVCNGGL